MGETVWGTALPVLAVLLGWALLFTVSRQDAVVVNRWNVVPMVGIVVLLTAVATATSDNDASDRGLYTRHFQWLDQSDSASGARFFEDEPLFNWLLWALARLVPPTEGALFGVVALLVCAGVLFAYGRLLPLWAVLPAFLTLLASGFLTNYAGVVIRQGLAIGCLLAALALAVQRRGRVLTLLVLLVAASLLHWTAVAPALAVLAVRLRDIPLRTAVAGWVVLAVLFVAGVQGALLGGLTQYLPAVSEYSRAEIFASYGGTANRLDFLALSAVVLAVALWLRRLARTPDPVTDRLVVVYVLWNALFLALGFVAFSDRLAAYSWFLAPLLLWRPLGEAGARSTVPLLLMGATIGLGVLTGVWGDLAGV